MVGDRSTAKMLVIVSNERPVLLPSKTGTRSTPTRSAAVFTGSNTETVCYQLHEICDYTAIHCDQLTKGANLLLSAYTDIHIKQNHLHSIQNLIELQQKFLQKW